MAVLSDRSGWPDDKDVLDWAASYCDLLLGSSFVIRADTSCPGRLESDFCSLRKFDSVFCFLIIYLLISVFNFRSIKFGWIIRDIKINHQISQENSSEHLIFSYNFFFAEEITKFYMGPSLDLHRFFCPFFFSNLYLHPSSHVPFFSINLIKYYAFIVYE